MDCSQDSVSDVGQDRGVARHQRFEQLTASYCFCPLPALIHWLLPAFNALEAGFSLSQQQELRKRFRHNMHLCHRAFSDSEEWFPFA